LFNDAVRNSLSARPDGKISRKALLAGINYKIERTKLLLTLAITAIGLAGRSAVDKILALRGGAELVAVWAQLSSVIEMIAGVALAGVGAGLSVLVAQTARRERQQLFLRRSLFLGLGASLPVAIAAGVVGARFPDLLGGNALSAHSVVLAAAAGWIAVIHGLVNSFWLGQQRRDLMLVLAGASAAVSLAAAVFAPRAFVMELIVLSQAAPALVLCFVPHRADAPARAEDHALQRYLLPGIVVGILSPASLLVARGMVGESLSWHDSGVLQALWRIADWVCGLAAGVLAVLYLPRFAAAYPRPGLGPVVREAAATVLLPSAALFVLLFAVHRPLLAALYDPSFEAPPAAVALLFAGSLVRIASWIALFALYAARRTRAIALGELFSLPLFAALAVAAGDTLTLESLGVFWLVAFLAYTAFNCWALRKA
jgi:O-antigen/teichoic acid export membrane protein